jgi:mono/diheme cytochrome c family protein/uncharacterized membrane protein
MKRVFSLLLAAVFTLAGLPAQAAPAKAPSKPPGKDEKLQLAAQVFKIFEAKCADCHGSHLPKPKGKFGYVLDLKRIADNPDYVTRGDAAKSEIYTMVKNDEMPGEDADVPPLTPEEKKIVESWVQAGAPHELPAGVAPGTSPVEKKPETQVTFLRRLANWLGKFHPLSTHFPVALLLTAVLAEALAWWLKRDEWMLLVRFLVVLGALSSVPTSVLGWLADFPTLNGSELATVYRFHQILGTATSAWALVCATLVCLSECEEGSVARRRFRGALLLGAFMIGVVGFLGGALNAGGLDHYKF